MAAVGLADAGDEIDASGSPRWSPGPLAIAARARPRDRLRARTSGSATRSTRCSRPATPRWCTRSCTCGRTSPRSPIAPGCSRCSTTHERGPTSAACSSRSAGAGSMQLIEALDDPRTPPAVRRHLPRTICRFRDSTAAGALVARLPHEPDARPSSRSCARSAACAPTIRTLPIDAAPIRAYVRRATRDAARYAIYADHLASHPIAPPTGALLARAARREPPDAIEHAFRALGDPASAR